MRGGSYQIIEQLKCCIEIQHPHFREVAHLLGH